MPGRARSRARRGARAPLGSKPHVPSLPKMRHHDLPEMASQPLTPEFLAGQDCVLIATDHTAYDYALIVKHSRLVIDTRNATKDVKSGREKIHKA